VCADQSARVPAGIKSLTRDELAFYFGPGRSRERWPV